MKMPQEHVERIAALGLHGTRGSLPVYGGDAFRLFHFAAFQHLYRGPSWKASCMAFAQKLLKHAHATVRDYMGTGSVFHLFSRLIYGQIEKDNVRNRRRHSFDYIRTRLVQMDFLLENPAIRLF